MAAVNNRVIKGITPSLQWLSDLLSFFQVETIRIPAHYREKVLVVKRMLNDDPSGLTNTILDFGISCALVDYKIETDNKNLTDALNDWLTGVNSELRGKIPTGLKALAKEYFRERWKGSSNLLLRTFWETKDGLDLPTAMFFVDGEDIKVTSKTDDGVLRLGDEQYYIKVGKPMDMKSKINDEDIALPTDPDNEVIFSQKPFEAWGIREPQPFLIKRGVFRASKMLELMSSKGEFIVGRALEYLLIMKKGTENMALKGNVAYSKEDLQLASDNLKEVVARKKSEPGFPAYTTNFDTDISEYIPDYTKAISQALYSPMEQRILAGLGMIEVVSGMQASARRESILNPKPFIGEVEQAIEDFKALLNDIIQTIIERNKGSHKKWMNAKITIASTPIKQFIDNDAKTMFRGLYDRGLISKQTATLILGDGLFNHDREVERRKQEKADGLDDIMEAPVIQNNGDQMLPDAAPSAKKGKSSPDKSGPEAKNYNKSQEIEQGQIIDTIAQLKTIELKEAQMKLIAKLTGVK